jgi:uncharacterized protein YodC (DUF2158 family)
MYGFDVGDIVVLQSGGPSMIIEVLENDGVVV